MKETSREQSAPDIVLAREAGRILGLSAQRVRQLADSGDLPVFAIAQPCGTRLFDRAAVVAFGQVRARRAVAQADGDGGA